MYANHVPSQLSRSNLRALQDITTFNLRKMNSNGIWIQQIVTFLPLPVSEVYFH